MTSQAHCSVLVPSCCLGHGSSRYALPLWFPFLFRCFFFFNDTATTEIYTLSLHDALPISILVAAAPRFLYCPVLVAAAPRFLYCPVLVAAAPRFLYCPFLVAAAPLHFILPVSRCGSIPAFLLTISRCGSAPTFYTARFSLRQRPRFLY